MQNIFKLRHWQPSHEEPFFVCVFVSKFDYESMSKKDLLMCLGELYSDLSYAKQNQSKYIAKNYSDSQEDQAYIHSIKCLCVSSIANILSMWRNELELLFEERVEFNDQMNAQHENLINQSREKIGL